MANMRRDRALLLGGLAVVALSVLLSVLVVPLMTPITLAANQPWAVVKGVNGQWPQITCGSGNTPVSCTEHWVLGTGSSDPPSGFGADGDLFWRTDTLSWKIKSSNQWSAQSEGGIPGLQKLSTTIGSAAVGTLFSVPVTLVTGVAGAMIVPERFHIVKAAGTAWTVGAGNLQIAHVGSATTMFSIAKANLFDQTGQRTVIGESPSFASYNETVHVMDGTSLQISLTAADMTAGSSALTGVVSRVG